MRKKSGFSLLELAIVIAISGMLMVGLMNFLNSMNTINRDNNNATKMQTVQKAINSFFGMQNRLPCPANPTLATTDANYGVEALDTNGLCEYTLTYNGSQVNAGFRNHVLSYRTGNTTFLANMDHKIIFGTVPFRTLSLPESVMYDEYGNKITYIVGQGYATNKGKAPSTSIYQRMNGWARVAFPSKFHLSTTGCSTTIFDPNANTGHTVNKNVCTEMISANCLSASSASPLVVATLVAHGWSNPNLTNVNAGDAIINTCRMNLKNYGGQYIAQENIAYLLISHGKNGFGAWNKSGTLNPQPTSTQEKKNTFEYYKNNYISMDLLANSTNTLDFVMDDKKIDFDDTVTYQTMSDILQDRKNNMYCHQSTINFDIPPGSSVSNAAPVQCHVWKLQKTATSVADTINPPSSLLTPSPACDTANNRVIDCTSGGLWANSA